MNFISVTLRGSMKKSMKSDGSFLFFFSFFSLQRKVKLLRTPRNSRCHIDFYFLPNACIHFLPIHRPTNSSRSTRLAYIQRSTWRDSPCPNYKLRHRRPLCCEPKSILLNMLNENMKSFATMRKVEKKREEEWKEKEKLRTPLIRFVGEPSG